MIRIKIEKIIETVDGDKNIGSAEFTIKQSELVETDVFKEIMTVVSQKI